MNPKNQSNQYQNPWPLWVHLVLALWKFTWFFLCSWTPKFFNPLRLLVLRVYGATITGIFIRPFESPYSIPWHLTARHRMAFEKEQMPTRLEQCTMEGAIAQEAYLCTWNTRFQRSLVSVNYKNDNRRGQCLQGVRAMIMPGITIENAIIGAQSVVTKT